MKAHSILCLGKDPSLLTTRCEVLALEGYRADWATPATIQEKLRAAKFDIVVFSVVLSRDEKASIRKMLADNVKVIDLNSLVMPRELLRLVAEASRA